MAPPLAEASESPSQAGTLGFLAPFRYRNFALLWGAMAASLLGDGLFLVALVWQVYALSNGPGAMGVVGVAMTVPHVLGLLLGGVLSDRLERCNLMVLADVVRGAAIGALGVLSITGMLQLWHVVALIAVYGAGNALFSPAFDALVPDVVPPDILTQANAVDQFVRPAALRLIGPAIGGWLVAVFGIGPAILINAGTFIISIVLVLCLDRYQLVSHHREPDAPGTNVIADLQEGFGFVRRHVWLWGTFLAATFAYLLFMGPTEVLLPFVVRNIMHGSALDLGFVFASGGVGAICAAVVVARHGLPRRHMTFIYIAWTASTVCVAGYGLARFPWQAMIASFAFNLFETAGTVVWLTTKQRYVPRALLGRVSSFDWFISIGLVPVSFALTGPIAEVFGVRATLAGAGVLGSAITLAFLFLPGMRSIETAPPTGMALSGQNDELSNGPTLVRR
jgi:DHA3 family tetracycline resistance protein-like MFS transporter